MRFVLGPGTGPVTGPTLQNAYANIVRFLKDVDVDGAYSCRRPMWDDGEGRFGFALKVGGDERSAEVLMPGCEIGQVRDPQGRAMTAAPRLYVDGNSWWWPYAVGIVRESLNQNQEEET